MTDLERLFFGRDDAESDVAEGGLLLAGFQRTYVYEAVRRGAKTLVIGRKGSGKSAICRALYAEDEPGLSTKLITPDTLSAGALRDFELTGIASTMAKKLIWRYALATETARFIVAHAERDHPKGKRPSVKALREFLTANGELAETRPRFWQIVEKLRTSLKLGAFGVNVELTVGGAPEGIKATAGLDLVEQRVIKAIEELACPADHPRLLLLVDQIEDVWSNDGESDALVRGLLTAAREASVRYPRVSCVTFLRSDIYDLLQFADKDKFHGMEIRIDWTAQSLSDLALARAVASVGHALAPTALWGELFPARHRDVPTARYLYGHTLGRPRDVIHLYNLCRDTAGFRGAPYVDGAAIDGAIREYSGWKLQDLANEYEVNYPFLDAVYPVFRDHGYIVMRTAFGERLAPHLDVLRDRFRDHAQILSAPALLEIFYSIGLLGVRRNSHLIYAHEHGDGVLLTDEEFHLHPCFREALRATAPTSAAVFDPSRAIAVGIHGFFGQRGSLDQRALAQLDHRIRRLLARLGRAGLPREAELSVDADLRRVLDHVHRFLSSGGSYYEEVSVISTHLNEMADRLVADGLIRASTTEFLATDLRTIGREARDTVYGIGRSGSGGSDS
ncbi:P-loop ATPase, Sll1717 family [Sphaerisporangium aureirubrum]|uniref:P-loop ATPase, Sll1717 family n=1 Tax=Sphaerisporangium aureirubrum TaxID=1544736 RepID=A0ABW1ND81_9ACTN